MNIYTTDDATVLRLLAEAEQSRTPYVRPCQNGHVQAVRVRSDGWRVRLWLGGVCYLTFPHCSDEEDIRKAREWADANIVEDRHRFMTVLVEAKCAEPDTHPWHLDWIAVRRFDLTGACPCASDMEAAAKQKLAEPACWVRGAAHGFSSF